MTTLQNLLQTFRKEREELAAAAAQQASSGIHSSIDGNDDNNGGEANTKQLSLKKAAIGPNSPSRRNLTHHVMNRQAASMEGGDSKKSSSPSRRRNLTQDLNNRETIDGTSLKRKGYLTKRPTHRRTCLVPITSEPSQPRNNERQQQNVDHHVVVGVQKSGRQPKGNGGNDDARGPRCCIAHYNATEAVEELST